MKMTPKYLQAIEDAWALVQEAAAAGLRCPTNDHFKSNGGALRELAYQGRIRIKVYAHNWRVVEIMEGPHAGKSTMRAPTSGPPYRVIDKDRSRLTHETGERHQRGEPSLPRLLTREELK